MTISFRKLRFVLRGGFLVRPMVIALSIGLAGAVLSQLEENVPAISTWVPSVLFPSRSDAQIAQVILSTIASSIMTIVSIVFAVLLMTLTLASMQFSPRIIVNFAQDKVTQQTLGIFLGTFGYCIAALPAARNLPHPFCPVFTVFGAMLLALSCAVGLLVFINHISRSISVNHIVDRLAMETEMMIDSLMPVKRDKNNLPGIILSPNINEAPILSVSSGYVTYIDTGRLLYLATYYKTVVRVVRRVGHYVPVSIPLMMIANGDQLTEKEQAEFLSAFELGPTRTLQQDVEFGILQIVDIALKAISPAVNDPSTAISCVDQLSAILIRFASRNPPDPIMVDQLSKVRVSIPWLDFERLVDAAYEQIRMYARTDVVVSLRMLRALNDIAHTLPDAASRQVLIERGRRIVAGCSKNFDEEEIKEMRARLISLEVYSKKPIPI